MKKCNAQSGNVLFIILIGIVLFSALAMVISRGMRSQGTTSMTARDAELAAVDIMNYAQQIERAVNRLRRTGASEGDISFVNNAVSGYAHSPVQANTNKVFHLSGGGVSWKSPPQAANDGSDWIFTGRTCIADVGNGATGCDVDSTSNEELVAVLPNITDEVCQKINMKLGLSTSITDSGGGYSSTKFTGSYSDNTEIIPAGGSYEHACVTYSSTNFYYSVLIAR